MRLLIREIRERQGLSQNKLGAKAGITAASISLIESYKRSPTLKNLEKIAKALNVKVRDLLDED
ncbi:helix-turn-helix domain-containing protein [Vallitalea sp.]|jgi:transcriptional regulator with XRE-family HTH domain|uniref:helix-turn-helix domain-containing protein n=1 Tax=Vallitalea sp. TaxID=1882829 RepID=UPI0025E0FE5F|nr:helix-turn-helix transcriptional regulator [Vallitalea sp.]MCT4686837.1 helix-turn-helix transcriptional regulator [Vallitalea sp.]